MSALIPTPRTPADNRCARHPTYLLASCAECQAVQHARCKAKR